MNWHILKTELDKAFSRRDRYANETESWSRCYVGLVAVDISAPTREVEAIESGLETSRRVEADQHGMWCIACLYYAGSIGQCGHVQPFDRRR
jgi:hypothetical protein